jgi:hypothetical protein
MSQSKEDITVVIIRLRRQKGPQIIILERQKGPQRRSAAKTENDNKRHRARKRKDAAGEKEKMTREEKVNYKSPYLGNTPRYTHNH